MFQMKLYVSEGMWEFNGFISWLSFKLGMDVVLYSEIITVLFKCLIFPPVRLQTLNRRHELTWAADLCSERFLLMFWCKQLLYSGWSFILMSLKLRNGEFISAFRFHPRLSFHTETASVPSALGIIMLCSVFISHCVWYHTWEHGALEARTRLSDSDTARINQLWLRSLYSLLRPVLNPADWRGFPGGSDPEHHHLAHVHGKSVSGAFHDVQRHRTEHRVLRRGAVNSSQHTQHTTLITHTVFHIEHTQCSGCSCEGTCIHSPPLTKTSRLVVNAERYTWIQCSAWIESAAFWSNGLQNLTPSG